MITLLDGPAAGVKLTLRRAPVMLRVVESRGSWDALDQLDDEPRRGEKVHVYLQVGQTTSVHICARNRAASGWFTIASYRHFPDQPGDAHTMTRQAWSDWCDTNKLSILEIKKAMEATL